MKDSKIIASAIAASLIILLGGYFFVSRQDQPKDLSKSAPNPALAIKADDWVRGEKDAPVVMVEYLDFQCPACGSYHPVVKQLEKEFVGKLAVVTRHFPLEQPHQYARLSARAAEAAGRQGKFFQMHDKLFEGQKEWSNAKDAKKIFISYAQDIGLNVEKFKKDIEDKPIDKKIDADQQSGTIAGVNSTPSFFINGAKIDNPESLDAFKALINAELKNVKITPKKSEKVHLHADFQLYINGTVFDFSQPQYQSTHDNELDEDAHLHNKNGKQIHVHERGVTIGKFLKTLKIDFAKKCLDVAGTKYCESLGVTSLKFYVNGKLNDQYQNYEIKDLDRILISYGPQNDSQIQSQISSVGDEACIYSQKCPERGKPEKEECVGGLGTECE